MSDTLYDLFQSNFPADRARPFLEVPGGRTWSYADLEEQTARLEACASLAGEACAWSPGCQTRPEATPVVPGESSL